MIPALTPGALRPRNPNSPLQPFAFFYASWRIRLEILPSEPQVHKSKKDRNRPGKLLRDGPCACVSSFGQGSARARQSMIKDSSIFRFGSMKWPLPVLCVSAPLRESILRLHQVHHRHSWYGSISRKLNACSWPNGGVGWLGNCQSETLKVALLVFARKTFQW